MDTCEFIVSVTPEGQKRCGLPASDDVCVSCEFIMCAGHAAPEEVYRNRITGVSVGPSCVGCAVKDAIKYGDLGFVLGRVTQHVSGEYVGDGSGVGFATYDTLPRALNDLREIASVTQQMIDTLEKAATALDNAHGAPAAT